MSIKTKASVATMLLAAACSVVLLVLHLHQRDDASREGTTAGSMSDQVRIPKSVSPEPTKIDLEIEVPTTYGSPLFLGDDCPDVLDVDVSTDEDCIRAIEEHFIDRAVYSISRTGIVPRDAPFTYREMFDSHDTDKKLVIAALSNADCRLVEGPIRMDLSETCNADAFYRYTYFTSVCHHASQWKDAFRPLASLGGKEAPSQSFPNESLQLPERENADVEKISRYQYRIEEYKALSNDDEDLYYKWRNSSREILLRNIWLDAFEMCPAYVVDSSLTPLDDSSSSEELLTWWGEGIHMSWRSRLELYAEEHRLPSDWADSIAELKPFEVLEAIAARLGFEWKLVVSEHVPGSFMDTAFMKSKSSVFPWMGHLSEAFRKSPLSRTQVVLNVVNGVIGLRESGYEADLDAIVAEICFTELEWKKKGVKDCATAIRNAESELDPQDIVALRTLDEIKAAALELNNYQYF